MMSLYCQFGYSVFSSPLKQIDLVQLVLKAKNEKYACVEEKRLYNGL
jgi:hypothetical protein